MPGPFDKLPAGSPITAVSVTAWNRMLDMLRWWVAQEAQTGANLIRGSRQPCIIDVKNTSGASVGWLGILGIDAPLYSPSDSPDGFKTRPVLKGVTPADPAHRGKFVVCLEPIPDGGVGKAVIAGVTPVLLAGAGDGGETADVSDGDATGLVPRFGGSAAILWKDGTGSGMALVRLGNLQEHPRIWLKLFNPTTNSDATAARVHSGHPCQWDGADEDTATTLLFSTAIRANKATALFQYAVVEVERQPSGIWVAVSDCYDDRMGTVKFWDLSSDPPAGWSILSDLAGRFPVGVDGGHALGGTGGSSTHHHTLDKQVCVNQTAVNDWTNTVANLNDVNHEPPWRGLYFIKRTS